MPELAAQNRSGSDSRWRYWPLNGTGADSAIFYRSVLELLIIFPSIHVVFCTCMITLLKNLFYGLQGIWRHQDRGLDFILQEIIMISLKPNYIQYIFNIFTYFSDDDDQLHASIQECIVNYFKCIKHKKIKTFTSLVKCRNQKHFNDLHKTMG